jgi:KipI family sensor histidine kinase inhibitor
MTGTGWRLSPLGEAAITVTLGDRVDPVVHDRVLDLARRVRAAQWPGIRDVVPAYAAVSVFFDPEKTSHARVSAALRTLQHSGAVPENSPLQTGREFHLAVRYDGPDLDEVATRTGLSRAEVIARHAARTYRVYLLGFVPGFAYLGELDPALALPRRVEPRQRVPAGAVAIAGEQTGIYPFPTPGGWHLIGTTGSRMFDPDRDPPALLAVGDRVRFEPVD